MITSAKTNCSTRPEASKRIWIARRCQDSKNATPYRSAMPTTAIMPALQNDGRGWRRRGGQFQGVLQARRSRPRISAYCMVQRRPRHVRFDNIALLHVQRDTGSGVDLVVQGAASGPNGQGSFSDLAGVDARHGATSSGSQLSLRGRLRQAPSVLRDPRITALRLDQ